MSVDAAYEKELSFQTDRRKATVEFIKIVSDLWYDKNIEVVLFRNQLIDKNVSEILRLHEYAGEFVQMMTPRDLSNMKVGQCKYVILVNQNGGVLNDPIY